MKLIYLAMPYSHPDSLVVDQRLRAVATFIAAHVYFNEGYVLFCSPLHRHSVAMVGGLCTDSETWWDINKEYINRCDELWVLCLAGWDLSKGVRDEIDYAELIGKPIKLKAPSELPS